MEPRHDRRDAAAGKEGEEPPRIERKISVGENMDAEQQAKLLEIADKTPVTKALAPGVPIQTDVRLADRYLDPAARCSCVASSANRIIAFSTRCQSCIQVRLTTRWSCSSRTSHPRRQLRRRRTRGRGPGCVTASKKSSCPPLRDYLPFLLRKAGHCAGRSGAAYLMEMLDEDHQVPWRVAKSLRIPLLPRIYSSAIAG